MNNQSFDFKRIAEGYAKDRPYLHPQVMAKVKNALSMEGKFHNGIDIGCGAGLSTKALKTICDKVTGTDISTEMIKIAKATCGEEGYSFSICKAEEIKSENPYDIATAAGVINWVEQEKFLENLNCCMVLGGYLIIYDFWITDRMVGENRYHDWWNNDYLKKFPKPFRKENVWTNQETAQFGFLIESQQEITMTWDFDMASFIRFMLIQSNVNEQIEKRSTTTEKAKEWFEETLMPVFDKQRKTLVFQGYIWYMKKIADG